jgi:DNA-binding SARP family transcriptional activator
MGGCAADMPQVHLVGWFAMRRGDRILTGTDVGSRKARTVLALLAVERGRKLPLDRIVEVLWNGRPPRQPARNVATMVSRLRCRFGADMVVGDGAGYQLGEGSTVDLYDAAALVDDVQAHLADHLPAPALAAARAAVDVLDRGGVLDDQPDAMWADPARALHGELLRRARHGIAEAALRLGQVWAAQAAAEGAVTADAFDEVARRWLMQAYAAAGEPVRALTAYQQLQGALATELGVDPAPATRELYVEILRGWRGRHRLPYSP